VSSNGVLDIIFLLLSLQFSRELAKKLHGRGQSIKLSLYNSFYEI
jgi:hypothetical protein